MKYFYESDTEKRFMKMQYDQAIAVLLERLLTNARYNEVFVVYDFKRRQVEHGKLHKAELTKYLIYSAVPAIQDSFALNAVARTHNRSVTQVVKDVMQTYSNRFIEREKNRKKQEELLQQLEVMEANDDE